MPLIFDSPQVVHVDLPKACRKGFYKTMVIVSPHARQSFIVSRHLFQKVGPYLRGKIGNFFLPVSYADKCPLPIFLYQLLNLQ